MPREMFIVVILMLNIYFNYTATIIYDKYNAMPMFRYYKSKYNRLYKNKIEEDRALYNFVNNLNKVTALNNDNKDKLKDYVLNRYADVDAEDFEERYAVNLKPYDSEPRGNIIGDQEKELFRGKTEQELGNVQLYDLTKADQLYSDYMKHYDKKKLTKKHDRTAHYYRFIKTLVDINRNHFMGKNLVTLDENADVVKEPTEYFY